MWLKSDLVVDWCSSWNKNFLQAALAEWQKATVAKANPKARIRCNISIKVIQPDSDVLLF